MVEIDAPPAFEDETTERVELEPVAELERACAAAEARDASCGEDNITRDCSFCARTERIEAKPVYECLAALPCGGDVEDCRALLAPHTVGGEVCERLVRCTPSLACDEADVASINDKLAWLNGETIDLLHRCLELPDCEASDRCILEFVAEYTPSQSES